MRQFYIARGAYSIPNVMTSSTANVGDFSVGRMHSDPDSQSNVADLIIKRQEGFDVIPLYAKDFTYSKLMYEAATTFEGTVGLGNISADNVVPGEQTVILIKKGVKFNERNKWTFSLYYNNPDISTISRDLIKLINESSCGCTATSSGGVNILIKANEPGIDYDIICTDGLSKFPITINKQGLPGTADGIYIADLAAKAAADKGFEYTYKDASEYLYPELNGESTVDDGVYAVYTFRFTEAREVGTGGDNVYQIVQFAITKAAEETMGNFETFLTQFGYSNFTLGSGIDGK